MKVLHYPIYYGQNVGMCNVLMSVECGIMMALATGREKVVFYYKSSIARSNKNINDLFDFSNKNLVIEFVKGELPDGKVIPGDFSNTMFYIGELPDDQFVYNRKNQVNLAEFVNNDQLVFASSMTLGFYSYMFYFGHNRDWYVDTLRDTIQIKPEYISVADAWGRILINNEGKAGYRSVHIRRGDYSSVNYWKNKDVTDEEILSSLSLIFPKDTNLLVHTDDEGGSLESVLSGHFKSVTMIDKRLKKSNPFYDNTQIGLISIILASRSSDFIGTMCSTFTGFIQRYRMYNMYKDQFRYLYSQFDGIALDRNTGTMPYGSFQKYQWSDQSYPQPFKESAFWNREYPSAYHSKRQNGRITIIPEFITDEESDYIINFTKQTIGNPAEFYQRENRDRVVMQMSDPVVARIAKRLREHGFDPSPTDGLQVFAQRKYGETFWHSDSMAPANGDCRSSSILFYLNDDFKGSDISFPFAGLTFRPKRNTMIAYPILNKYREQTEITSHSAAIITEGVKFMCYFNERKIR